MESVIKENPHAPSGFFEAEAAGLRWLAAAPRGLATPEVLNIRPGRIELSRVVSARPTADAARTFGAALAQAHHSVSAETYGPGPLGPEAPLFIGQLPMSSAPHRTWGHFYSEGRVRPFLEPASQAGNLTHSQRQLAEDVCDLIAEGAFDVQPGEVGDHPVRIHGDLWNGNVLWSPTGVVVIDPAAHWGHPLTDLAMLELFGVPLLGEIKAAYGEHVRLPDETQEWVALHQLHPLAVHAVGHGPGYGVALADAAARVLTAAQG